MNSKVFINAVGNEDRRERYLEYFNNVRPSFISKIYYVRPEKVLKLQERFGVIVKNENFAKTYPINPTQITLGTNSEIHIYSLSFDTYYNYNSKLLHSSYSSISKNRILNHEFKHAEHYFSGIEGFELDEFKTNLGQFNNILFEIISEIEAYKFEINGLKKLKIDPVIKNEEILKLTKEAQIYYNMLFNSEIISTNNPKLILKIRKKLNPNSFY